MVGYKKRNESRHSLRLCAQIRVAGWLGGRVELQAESLQEAEIDQEID